MNCGYSVYFRRLAGVGVMVAILVTALAPAMAASQAQPADSAFSKKSIARVVANTKPATETPRTTPQATRSGSFFKTRTGVLVLVVMAAGAGYAVYSAKEDRIKGINR